MGQWFEGYRTNTGSYDNPTNKWLAIYDDAASMVRTHPCWWSSKWRGWEENMFCVLVAQIGCEWSSDKALSCQSPNRTTGNKERAINKTRRSGGAMGPILGVNTLLLKRTTTPRRTMSLQERRSWGEEVQKEREVDWGQMRATCQRLDYMHCHPPQGNTFWFPLQDSRKQEPQEASIASTLIRDKYLLQYLLSAQTKNLHFQSSRGLLWSNLQ